MNLNVGSKTIPISTKLLAQFIEEKLDQFGFSDDDLITKIELVGLPQTVLVKIKSKKEKEVTQRIYNG